MTDETNRELEETAALVEQLGNFQQSTNAQVEYFQVLMDKGLVPKDLEKTFAGATKEAGRFDSGVKDVGDGWKKLYEIMKSGQDTMGGLFKNASPEKVKNVLKGAMVGVADTINEAFKTMETLSKGVTQSVAAIGTIGFAKAKVEAMKLLEETGYIDLEKQLMGIQKAALQMGMAFGESHDEASGSVEFFQSSMMQTMKTLQATEEEIKTTHNALKEAFSAKDMFNNIRDFDGSLKDVSSTINLTNVALGVSRSMGMEVSDVSKKMSDMHLKLGSSLKDTALAFGNIRSIAKDSGLTYKTVSDTVIESAKTLKFYGATVESVSPIFKTFNESLKGIGKEGLTPKLMEDFVGGLQQMQFNTRALLGLSMPGGGGGSILGGGLKVEKAMETGEGMGDVIKSISETMKKFGGPRIITRDEAIDSPSAETNFMIQRQIFGSLSGIKDSGKQNQMMQVLQDIDRHGIKASSDGIDKFGELMKAGEKVADETTDRLTKAELQYQRTRIGQGTQIVKHLKTIASASGVRDLLKSMDKLIDTTTTSVGDINFDEFGKTLAEIGSDVSGAQPKIIETKMAVKEARLKEIEIKLKDPETSRGEKKALKTEKGKIEKTMEVLGKFLRELKTAAPEKTKGGVEAGAIRGGQTEAEYFSEDNALKRLHPEVASTEDDIKAAKIIGEDTAPSENGLKLAANPRPTAEEITATPVAAVAPLPPPPPPITIILEVDNDIFKKKTVEVLSKEALGNPD